MEEGNGVKGYTNFKLFGSTIRVNSNKPYLVYVICVVVILLCLGTVAAVVKLIFGLNWFLSSAISIIWFLFENRHMLFGKKE